MGSCVVMSFPPSPPKNSFGRERMSPGIGRVLLMRISLCDAQIESLTAGQRERQSHLRVVNATTPQLQAHVLRRVEGTNRSRSCKANAFSRRRDRYETFPAPLRRFGKHDVGARRFSGDRSRRKAAKSLDEVQQL